MADDEEKEPSFWEKLGVALKLYPEATKAVVKKVTGSEQAASVVGTITAPIGAIGGAMLPKAPEEGTTKEKEEVEKNVPAPEEVPEWLPSWFIITTVLALVILIVIVLLVT